LKAHVTILGDIAIEFREIKERYLSDRFKVVYIGTFSGDEPLEMVLNVASRLPEVDFYITGNLKHDKKNLHNKYPLSNVKFTDFLPDEEYLRLLKSADAAMILTTMNHTMQRGAYEAMSMSKPIIVSDWPILRQTFYKGTILVLNNEESIEQGILEMIAGKKRFEQEICELREERLKLYERSIADLRKIILEQYFLRGLKGRRQSA
jgi:glycosyltransferase involved in cell wall biosynthesis